MDRTNDTEAVIESFAKLPSGLAGAIEMHGGIPPGSVLVAINQKDVSGLNMKQVSDILREQKDKPKVLGWRIHKPLSPLKTDAAPPTPFSVMAPPLADRRASNGTEFVTENIVVLCPSGPLGLLLDGQVKHRAVVQGFQTLPDGSPGVLELHDSIHPGASLVAINGEDVSAWPLDAVTQRLGELASTERILEFALPRRRANSQDFDLRRKEEFTFLKKHDKTKIARGECWLVIDAKWIERWVLYAAMSGPPPGPITNEALVMDGWQERLTGAIAGDADLPRPNLKVGVDYRCVTPLVWCFFVALHGTSKLRPSLATRWTFTRARSRHSRPTKSSSPCRSRPRPRSPRSRRGATSSRHAIARCHGFVC
ncbi:hypothetical protein SPRG_02097 [Saprolegnia parasitica CBS 223.65]|uniref:DUSP domain-containing protein n=1 Tax=Saprolegnia parasitica (strain CBS 223.65) TaxID=695850 RepID=A0A067CS21_SAPPC|nr:hypothetical protein SPRG_02097 [Saprolegnia parasitica CBS 223.65]KDO33288.1 hypothetical protein SPRG_02097 [Saprolegnia parasitica CBS 223.65]|eukprot:XP_012196038.1 hypothetical protein SPRG_02097 [Saprolegnia parasitica CBS 223.65]